MTSVEQSFGFPYWLDFERPAFPMLAGDQTADAVVIGAGIAGLKLARCLAERGMQVIVLEGARVGAGASSRNQGAINNSPNLGYQECIRLHSRDIARDLWSLGLENQRLLRQQIEEYEIDCDYHVAGFAFLARRDVAGWEQRLEEWQSDYSLLRDDGFEVAWLDQQAAQSAGGSELFAGGVCYCGDTQFHSGRFVVGLAQGVARSPRVRLFEGARVQSIEREGSATRVETGSGAVRAPVVFLTTNALAPQYVPGLAGALRAERGQVIVTEPLPFRSCSGSFGAALAWWREVREADGRFRLLFGGGRARDEPDSLFPQYARDGRPHPLLEVGGFSPSAEHQRRLETQLALLFPRIAGCAITHRWGGLQSFTADNLPEIGLFDPERRLYGMAGFCGRGNYHADAGADYLAGLVTGVQSDVQRRFGYLFDTLMRVGRESAVWGPWQTAIPDSSELQ